MKISNIMQEHRKFNMGEHTGGTATFKKQNDGVRNVAVGRERA
jgi:hypothetical protein